MNPAITSLIFVAVFAAFVLLVLAIGMAGSRQSPLERCIGEDYPQHVPCQLESGYVIEEMPEHD